MKSQKALFLDRDGTLIVDKHYLSQEKDIEYFPDTISSLKIFKNLGYELFIVTNQSGIGRGYFSSEVVEAIHQKIQDDFIQYGVGPIVEFAICPHAPEDQCLCRKPSGLMIKNLLQKHHLDPSLCFMIGDKIIDVQAGKNAGVEGVLVRAETHDHHLTFNTLEHLAQYLSSLQEKRSL